MNNKMKSPTLNELSPETKMSAFKKAAAYTRKPGEITNKVLHNKRMSQAYTFEKHVSPQIQAQANTIAKLIGSEFIASIDKYMPIGSEEIPAIHIKFYEPTNKKNNVELFVSTGTGYNAGEISTDLKLNNIEISEPIQRKLVRFADAVYKSEISSDLKENHNIKRTMNKSTLKSLIRECYREVLAENEEMDLPTDTGKNINMGFDNNVGLDVDKRMSANIDKIRKQIENLTNELKPLIAAFNVAQKELQSKLASKQITKDEYDMQRSLIAKNYDEATKGLVASLKKAKLADEVMLAKLK
jgi:hypothetical protein